MRPESYEKYQIIFFSYIRNRPERLLKILVNTDVLKFSEKIPKSILVFKFFVTLVESSNR